MEAAIAFIIFGLIATLVMPNLLTKEITIALIVLGTLAILMPRTFSRELTLALFAFGMLFTLVIPPLMK
jgi:hypothetical protein